MNETLASVLAQAEEDAIAGVGGRAPISRAEIAEDCGQLYSLFSRQLNPNDPIHFPADQLIPFILATGDARPLEFLVRHTAHVTGLVLVKDRPRWRPLPQLILRHQKLLNDYATQLFGWINNELSKTEMLKTLDRVRGEILSVRRAVAKSKEGDPRQKKLF